MRDSPAFTETLPPGQSFIPPPGSAYLFGQTAEARSQFSPSFFQQCQGVRFVELIEGPDRAVVGYSDGAWSGSTRLRSIQQIDAFFASIPESPVFLDVTGLAHSTWAPLMRGALRGGRDIRAVYAEPLEYSRSSNPPEGELFDLSEKIGRIEPLPGFASLQSLDGRPILIAFLGFEGNRFTNLQEAVQAHDIYPIVGVPGFRIEYPLNTLFGNRLTLRNTRSWQNMHLVRADCPFSAYYVLVEITSQFAPKAGVRIAPIGTKPHAIGAVLFTLASDRTVEIVYDNPKRKPGRTTGASRIHVYHIAALDYRRERLAGVEAEPEEDDM